RRTRVTRRVSLLLLAVCGMVGGCGEGWEPPRAVGQASFALTKGKGAKKDKKGRRFVAERALVAFQQGLAADQIDRLLGEFDARVADRIAAIGVYGVALAPGADGIGRASCRERAG